MKNAQIKQLAKEKGIKLWQVAEVYGISDGNFSRLLRKELPKEKEEKILSIINNYNKERQVKAC